MLLLYLVECSIVELFGTVLLLLLYLSPRVVQVDVYHTKWYIVLPQCIWFGGVCCFQY